LSDVLKTTPRLPHERLNRVNIRAIEEERDLQELTADALEHYLSKAGKVSRGECQ